MKRRDLMLGATLASTAWPLLPAHAQSGFDRPPEAPPAPPLNPLSLQQARLDNGLRIVLLQRPGQPRAALRLIGDGGWLRDPAGKEGLAEVALSMLAQGAKRGGEVLESADIAYAGDLLGRPLRLDLRPAAAELALEAQADDRDDAFNLLADLASAPTLAFEALEHIRSRAIDALMLRRADALLLAPWAARRVFWGKSLPVQTAASLKRLKRDDVQGFHRQYWRPERSQLLVVGDVSLEAARALAADVFADWKMPKAPPLPPVTGASALAAATPAGPTALFLPLPQGQGCRLMVQTPIPRGTPPALRALAAELMHQRLSARLPWPWDSDMETLGSACCWRLSVTLPGAAVAEQLALLREQLPRLAAEPVTPEDLALAQAQCLGDWSWALAEAPDELLAPALAAGELEDVAQWPQRLKAVSAPVLQLLMGSAWRENRTQVLLLGDAGPAEAAQRAWPGLALTTMRSVIGE